jgi:hypothetical protein
VQARASEPFTKLERALTVTGTLVREERRPLLEYSCGTQCFVRIQTITVTVTSSVDAVAGLEIWTTNGVAYVDREEEKTLLDAVRVIKLEPILTAAQPRRISYTTRGHITLCRAPGGYDSFELILRRKDLDGTPIVIDMPAVRLAAFEVALSKELAGG